jgi:hypothetical protein
VVGATLLVFAFRAVAKYLSHQGRGRPQVAAKLTVPQAASAPPVARPLPTEIPLPRAFAITGHNTSGPNVSQFGSRPTKPLALRAAQAQDITDGMKRFAGQSVEIRLAGNVTAEAQAFADALEVALLSADMLVTRSVSTTDAVGDGLTPPLGVSVLVGKNRISNGSAPNALALLLISNKVVDGLIPAFPSERSPDSFTVLVTGASD